MIDFKYAILFIKPNNKVHHIILEEELPVISSLRCYFDELLYDEEFGVKQKEIVDSLRVAILDKDSFFDVFPDFSQISSEFSIE